MKEVFEEYIGLLRGKIERRDPVYRTQCQLSFRDPASEGGLYVNLRSFEAYSAEFLEWDHVLSGCRLYLSIKSTRRYHPEGVENPTDLSIGKKGGYFPEKAFYEDLFHYSLVSLPDRREVGIADGQVPAELAGLLNYIVQYDQSAELKKDADSAVAWAEERRVSRHADNLLQVSSPKQVPPKGWVCEKCGASTNLWLNLSDGFIGCGRRLYGVGGGCFGGKEEGAALLHYQQNPEMPLAVKLGTITQFGSADVFSYDPQEDDLVVDPHLTKHLSVFGINVGQLEKTEKSLTEMQIEQNNKLDLTSGAEAEEEGQFTPMSQLCEEGGQAILVGLENSGNSCYINVVLQLLAAVPEVERLFSGRFQELLEIYSASLSQKMRPRESVVLQFSKVIRALLSDYVIKDRQYKVEVRSPDVQRAISELKEREINEKIIDSLTEGELSPSQFHVLPSVLKKAVAKGNPEFSSSHQQDTLEYFTFLQEKLSADLAMYSSHASGELQTLIKDFITLFSFFLGERLECKQSASVKLTSQLSSVLSLPIPMDLIAVCSETRQSKRPKHLDTDASLTPHSSEQERAESDELLGDISLLLSNWKQEEIVDNFVSPCTGLPGKAGKSNFMKTMPKYLIVHMQRFYLSEDWKPKKISLRVKVPDLLDLEILRGSDDLGPGEKPFPKEEQQQQQVEVELNTGSGSGSGLQVPESLLNSVLDLGFTRTHAELAVKNTSSTDTDQCVNWILTNIDTINSMSLTSSSSSSSSSGGGGSASSPLDQEAIDSIVSICCCTRDTAEKALRISNHSLERAVQMIFDDPSMVESFQETQSPAVGPEASGPPELEDGPGRYELVGVICHLGKSVHSGHYVCYIRRRTGSSSGPEQLSWVKFNDTKVHISREDDFPQKEKGYIYLFRRVAQ
ncbi:UBP zn finger and UBA domain-containing protein [Cryptosporidium canis]|uniref:Ubiquitin carboxyl-terminal hydrolase n=1 Tax=Cryptosporidium canis TaxID=195482 RepID=A0ABQ8P742_9CRYT|nr:UBP zn finger and UBA domain-containing protein [Cryptosporidium canis]